jgi:hypothetical protein
MIRRHFLVFVQAAFLLGCSNSVANDNSQPPQMPAGSAIITTQGGVVTLPNVATVTFPANSFSVPTQVQISQVPTQALDEDFSGIISLFSASSVSSSSVQVSMGTSQPAGLVNVTLVAPALYTSGRPRGFQVGIMAAVENEGDMELVYPTFELVHASVDQTLSTASIDIDAGFFSRQDTAGRHLGIFTLVLRPGPN